MGLDTSSYEVKIVENNTTHLHAKLGRVRRPSQQYICSLVDSQYLSRPKLATLFQVLCNDEVLGARPLRGLHHCVGYWVPSVNMIQETLVNSGIIQNCITSTRNNDRNH